MVKKSGKGNASTDTSKGRDDKSSLPRDLEERLQAIWRRLGHLVEWCDNGTAWTRVFRSEARPYRQTFYWEAVADMVSDYMLEHPTASPEGILTDCLVATQNPSSADDRERLTEFRKMWGEILDRSREEIEVFIQADLELAAREGKYETVARLYAIDYQRLQNGNELLPD